MHVKFEFGHSPMIFERAIPLEKKISFRSLAFVWMYVQMYKVDITCVNTSKECEGQVQIWLIGPMSFDSLKVLHENRKKLKFSFSAL
jgi:hypothetical protein